MCSISLHVYVTLDCDHGLVNGVELRDVSLYYYLYSELILLLVVVVNRQMPRGRLKFGGRWTLEDSGRDYALKSTHEKTNTHGFTQVRGSREEIKPLLLLV